MRWQGLFSAAATGGEKAARLSPKPAPQWCATGENAGPNNERDESRQGKQWLQVVAVNAGNSF